MYCSKCGSRLADDARFCNNCGCDVSTGATSQQWNADSFDQSGNMNSQTKNDYESGGVPNAGHTGGKTNMLTAVLAATVLCFLGIAAAFGVFYVTDSWIFSDDTPSTVQYVNSNTNQDESADTAVGEEETNAEPESEDEEPIPPEPEPVMFDVLEIDNYINANTTRGNVAFSVIDNKTGEKYDSDFAYKTYSAWGFYLPIYLLYPLDDIMSSEPGVCNTAANNIIRYLGGTEIVTSHLRTQYSLHSTTYGRMFGDTSSSNDNYTCASDAATLLNVLNSLGKHSYLCYNHSKFGVTAPYGSTMYAQIGTENISQKAKLNIFAVIKGNNSDYSVAILTEGYNSSLITPLLEKIHVQMESL